MRKFGILLAVLLLIVLAACESILMMSCGTTDLIGGHVSCNGGIEKLDNQQFADFNVGDLSTGNSVLGQLTFTAMGGRARVSYMDNNLRTVVGEVAPDQPYTIHDRMYVSYSFEDTYVRVTIDPFDGGATGVKFTAEFDR